MNAEQRLTRFAAKQHGVFSRAEALAIGLSSSTIDRRVATGRWERVHQGVYRFPGAPRTWHQQLMAALLWAGKNAVISHRAAAALLGFPGFESGIVELTVDRWRRPPAGIILHTTDRLPRSDRMKLGSLVVTSIARTLIDLGSVESEDVVEIALESALGKRQSTIEQLLRKVDNLEGHGRRGTSTIKRLLAVRVPGYKPTASVFETKFFQVLRRYGRPLPERQFVITDGDTFIACVDFAFTERKLAIECESFEHHSDVRGLEDDLKRHNPLARVGWRIVRVTWSDLMNPERILRDIFPQWPSDIAG
jgi:very-short-patch-repair endonuclease